MGIMLWSNPAFQSQFNIFAWDKVHAARNLEARELADKNTWGDELETETPSEKPCAGLKAGDVFKDDNIVQNNLYYVCEMVDKELRAMTYRCKSDSEQLQCVAARKARGETL